MPLYMGELMLNDATSVADINEQLPVVAEHLSAKMKEAVVDLAHTLPPPAERAQQAPPAAVDNVTWTPTGDGKIKTDRAVVLENAAYGYKRPNIVDVKLGQRLWADNAPEQKRRKFDQIRAATTHEKYGFRIAGMRVYKGADDPAELDKEDYKIYDKDWGRTTVNNDNIVDAFRKFVFNASAGIDDEIGRAVAGAFKRDLERVRDVLEREESRMYSSSLLFIFEGDGEALRAAIDEASASAAASDKGKVAGGRSNSRVDSGIELDDDGEMVLPELMGSDGEMTMNLLGSVDDIDIAEKMAPLLKSTYGGATLLGSDDNARNFIVLKEDDLDDIDDEDDDDDEEETAREPRIYGLKLIDFAHAKWVPNEGPDENVLVGVRSLIQIFDELEQEGGERK